MYKSTIAISLLCEVVGPAAVSTQPLSSPLQLSCLFAAVAAEKTPAKADEMGMVTIHLVVGVGVLILPLCLILFSLGGDLGAEMNLSNLYIIIGAISFVTSVVTTIVLGTKFINQPAAHGFFSYSDTMASALFSLGLLLDGVLKPGDNNGCYKFYLIYGLFVVPIITGFFSVLGTAIERFQAFAVYRDTRWESYSLICVPCN